MRLIQLGHVEGTSCEQPEHEYRPNQDSETGGTGRVAPVTCEALDQTGRVEDSQKAEQPKESQWSDTRNTSDQVDPMVANISPRCRIIQKTQQEFQKEHQREGPHC